MSTDELRERIKDEVVLREGDLFEWQWRQLGLVAEAEEMGVSEPEFLVMVNDVSRAINPYFGRIIDLKINVADLARLHGKKLTPAQVDQIVADATRLLLQPDFVRNRWIPAILATVPEPTDTPVAPAPVAVAPAALPAFVPPVSEASPAETFVKTPPAQSAQPTLPPPVLRPAAGIDRDGVTRKVHQFLDEYIADKHIPARTLKPLFLATNFDETILADAVLAYLSANFYAAETPVRGETLTAKLLSTDWRHLSWWERSGTGSVAPVAATHPVRAAQRGQSDSTVIGVAFLAVGLLVGGAWWVTRDKPAETPKATITTVPPADSTPAKSSKKKSRKKTQKRNIVNPVSGRL